MLIVISVERPSGPDTHTDRYLDYNNNHPISAKLSIIHTFIHTAKQVCSTSEFPAKEMDHLHKVLQDNHYPIQFFQQGKPNRKPTKSQTHLQESLQKKVHLSYHTYKGLSEQYRHTLAKYKVNSFLQRYQHHQIFIHASKRSNSRCTENWYNLPLEMPNQQLHSWIHRWNQQVPERKFQTIEIKPPVPSETTTSPQNIQKQNFKILQ